MPATYELWTQIDPDTTGLVASGDGIGDLADLAATRPGPDGAVPIRLIQTGERLSERRVEGLLAGAQALALAGRFAQPAVSFAPAPESGDGIALAVAPAAELARSLDIASLGPVTGPRLALLPGRPDRRPVVVVTGPGEADVTAALAQLGELAAAPPRGTPQGLDALRDANGRPITGGESLALADLGLDDVVVGGRTAQLTLDLALPHDLLAADYAKIALDLDATYPAGLAPGAQVSVAINGEAAGSVPLGKAGGETLHRRGSSCPCACCARGPTGSPCWPNCPGRRPRLRRPGGPRLTLRASTRLTIPDLARIARQPELAATAAAGFPYRAGIEGRAPTLSVPAPDRDTMAAGRHPGDAPRRGGGPADPLRLRGRAQRRGRADRDGGGPAQPRRAAPDGRRPRPAGLRDAWMRRDDGAPNPAPEASPIVRRQLLRRGGIPGCRATATAALGLPEAALVLAQG